MPNGDSRGSAAKIVVALLVIAVSGFVGMTITHMISPGHQASLMQGENRDRILETMQATLEMVRVGLGENTAVIAGLKATLEAQDRLGRNSSGR